MNFLQTRMSAHNLTHVIRFAQTLWDHLHAAVDMGTDILRMETIVKVLMDMQHINLT